MDKQTPRHDEIERRAYAIYLARGAQDGSDLADWLAAEQELTRVVAQTHSAISAKSRDAAA